MGLGYKAAQSDLQALQKISDRRMIIGVISDTHIPVAAAKLPRRLMNRLRGCDLIVHAGDITEMSVIECLQGIAEVRAVSGNMDSMKVKNNLPPRLLFKADGKRIGVVHGTGRGSEPLESAKKTFHKCADIIIFGHSHNPVNRTIDGKLYMNPGSPTDMVFTSYRSFGIIELNNGGVRSEIIKFED
ncbi:MAG: YfcE family phosphodiesterase [Candidatus Omnitrophica bacterium]|nr:YfcE family phosphodiesterase [Candidatus Omnitrophota bacterium]